MVKNRPSQHLTTRLSVATTWTLDLGIMGKIPGSIEEFLEILVVDIKFNREKTMLEGNKTMKTSQKPKPPRHADAQIRLHLIEGTRALLGYLEEATAWQVVGSVGWVGWMVWVLIFDKLVKLG